jgi:hypothetical protein
MKPKVFIGSSIEGLPVAQAIKRRLAASAESVLWIEDPIFTAGETTVEALARVAPEFDMALMVWTKDDESVYRKAASRVPRDNVVLEYGFFSGVLGRTRCLIVAEEKVRVPTDTNGITYIQLSSKAIKNGLTGPAMSQVLAKIKVAIEREGLHPARRFAESFSNAQTLDTDEATSRVLKLGVRGLSRVSGIEHSLGLHLWLLVGTPSGPRMRRYGRTRLGDDARPNNWGDFERGRGVVGSVWRTGSSVEMVFTKPPFASVTDAAEWRQISVDARLGTPWSMFVKAKRDFAALVGVPLMDSSACVVGALSANAGRSVSRPERLVSDKSRNWLEDVAGAAWEALPAELRASASLLGSIP